MRVKFTILGEPAGKGRPRFSTVTGTAVTPEKTARYENLVKVEYRRQCGDTFFPEKHPLSILIYAFYGIPKSTSKKKTQAMLNGEIRPVKTPDYDNVAKIVSDSLNKIAYHDDAQIVDCIVRKFYSDRPRVVVFIDSVDCVPEIFEKIKNL